MTKGSRILVFVVLASLANILITFAFFLFFLWIYSISLAELFPQTAIVWAIAGDFLLSMLAAFFIYKKLLPYAKSKFKLEEHR